jgi:small neutral amino acid transporter SnatA (MarC family)
MNYGRVSSVSCRLGTRPRKDSHTSSSGPLVALIAIVIVMVVSWVALRQTDRIYRLLGRTGAAVIARIIYLFIAAIAVQYVLNGIQFYYPPR